MADATRRRSPIPRVYLISTAFQAEYEAGFANGLVRQGVPVTVIGANRSLPERLDGEVEFLNLRDDQDPRRSTRAKVLNLLRYFVALRRLALRQPTAIFHTNGLFALRRGIGVVLEAAWCRLIFREWWLTVHNLLPHDDETLINALSFRLAYKLPDRLFVHTAATAAALAETFAVDRERIHVVEHGIDRFIEPDATAKARVARRFALPAFGTLILLLGRIARYKGVDVLLDAAERANPPADTLVLIAGPSASPEYGAELRARMASMRHAHRVVWRDEYLADADIPPLLAAADCMVLPYRKIDQSAVLFAAKSAGLPIIASDVGSFRDYAEPGYDLLVPPADVEALAKALAEMAGREPSAGRTERIESARKKYAWQVTLRSYADLVKVGYDTLR